VQTSKRRAPSQPAQTLLERPATALAGVGPRLSERLARLGVHTVADVLCLLPLRYEDRTQVRPLGSLKPGERALVEGRIELAEVAFRRRRSLLCRLADGTGAITLRFFHFSRQQQSALERGLQLRCFGEVRAGPTGLEMIHPEYRSVGEAESAAEDTLTPIYPATEGLQQQRLRRLVAEALAALASEPMADYLADRLPRDHPSINEAICLLHAPPRDSDVAALARRRHPAQRRIALEELIAHRLSLRGLASVARLEGAHAIAADDGSVARLRAALPFALTAGQCKAWEEISADLRKAVPMQRLLQGDVGSGKTVVAALAMQSACAAGYQAALMAPTELLAEQHLATLGRWLAPLGIEIALLSSAISGAARTEALRRIANGTAQVVIGTHALFQQAVGFERLALVVVDEQHRFGVAQRLELMRKGTREERVPHQLIMTATPIPRTLAMTAYADLDCSVIEGLPPGRKAVQTVVLPEQRRSELVERVREHCARGHQAYWVCPLIEESEALDSQAALALERDLAAALPDVRLGLIHGRLRATERDEVMRAFKDAKIDLLVATTVIEVGVDVPNASLMIVENAERMGLAQLHQLRGRVGRGHTASSCVLLYKPPLTDVARERLKVMRETTDGFVVAQKDLELRGPGEVLGTRQTGVFALRIANLVDDSDLLPAVIRISDAIERERPERVAPLVRRWIRTGAEYAKV
jgi:ATP-dependent DNA helicase RecG